MSESEYRGMNVRKIFAIPKNERKCLTVSGAGHFTMTATFDSVGAQPSADNRKPKNWTSDRKRTLNQEFMCTQCFQDCIEFVEMFYQVI